VSEHAIGAVESTGTANVTAQNAAGHEEHNPGRPISWVGTAIVIVGFVVGGAAMIPGPHWPLFWVGAGIAIVGCLILAFSKAMNTDWY
jgi:hypothetical protein